MKILYHELDEFNFDNKMYLILLYNFCFLCSILSGSKSKQSWTFLNIYNYNIGIASIFTAIYIHYLYFF